MTTSRSTILLLLLALSTACSACGGVALVPDQSTTEPTSTPTPGTNNGPNRPDLPPPPIDEEPRPVTEPQSPCDVSALAWSSGSFALSTIALPSMRLAPVGPLRCYVAPSSGVNVESLVDLTVTTEGVGYALTMNGYIARITLVPGAPSCEIVTRLPEAETRRYLGLATVKGPSGRDELVTLRAGTAAEYRDDGAYHHTLVAIDPTSLATEARGTVDAGSYPDHLDASGSGTLLLRYASDVVEVGRNGATVRTFAPLGLGKWRSTLATRDTWYATGDVHDAPNGGGLPTYAYDFATGLTTSGPMVTPAVQSNGLVVGASYCASTH